MMVSIDNGMECISFIPASEVVFCFLHVVGALGCMYNSGKHSLDDGAIYVGIGFTCNTPVIQLTLSSASHDN